MRCGAMHRRVPRRYQVFRMENFSWFRQNSGQTNCPRKSWANRQISLNHVISLRISPKPPPQPAQTWTDDKSQCNVQWWTMLWLERLHLSMSRISVLVKCISSAWTDSWTATIDCMCLAASLWIATKPNETEQKSCEHIKYYLQWWAIILSMCPLKAKQRRTNLKHLRFSDETTKNGEWESSRV